MSVRKDDLSPFEEKRINRNKYIDKTIRYCKLMRSIDSYYLPTCLVIITGDFLLFCTYSMNEIAINVAF